MNALVSVAEPDGVVTTTLYVPAALAGVVNAIVVDVVAPRVAAVPPTVKLVTVERFVPVKTTDVLPAVGPYATESDVTVGALAL